MSAFVYNSPEHVGDPTNVYFRDRLEKRVEFRRLSDQGRAFTYKVSEICATCARREVGERRPVDATASLFGSES